MVIFERSRKITNKTLNISFLMSGNAKIIVLENGEKSFGNSEYVIQEG